MYSLVAIITNRCNLACSTCLRAKDGRDLSPVLFAKVLTQAKKLGCRHIRLTGGEPCLHPKFASIIRAIVNHGMTFSIATNGTGNYLHLKIQYMNQFKRIAVSLDGTEQVHDSIRGPGSFRIATESVKAALSHGLYVRLQACLNRQNIDQISEIAEIARDLGVHELGFLGLIRTRENRPLWISEKEKAVARDKIGRLSTGLKVTCANSLGGYSGIGFCNGLNTISELTIAPNGSLGFCCDTIRNCAAIGSLQKYSLLNLYHKAADCASYLKKLRASAISENKAYPAFDSCEFCNRELEELTQ